MLTLNKNAKKSLKVVKDSFLNDQSITIPSDFRFTVEINERYSFSSDPKSRVKLLLRDDKKKYFWTMDDFLEIDIYDGKLEINEIQPASGCRQSHYYGDEKKSNIDIIEINKVMLSINKFYIDAAVKSVDDPKIIIDLVNDYLSKYKAYDNLRDEYLEDVKEIKSHKQEIDTKIINDAFKKIPQKSVDRIEKDLRSTDGGLNS